MAKIVGNNNLYFSSLYLIGIYQPLAKHVLVADLGRLATAGGESVPTEAEVTEILRVLVRNKLIIHDRHVYSTTPKGIERLGKFGYRVARDKNRFFLLKLRFKREYNLIRAKDH